MYMQVTYESGKVEKTEDKSFQKTVEAVQVEAAENPDIDMSKTKLFNLIMEQLTSVSDELENGVGELQKFKIIPEDGSVCYINTAKIESIKLFGVEQFTLDALAYAEEHNIT